MVEYVRQKEEDLHKYFIQPGEGYFLIYFTEKERTRENEKQMEGFY